MNPSLEVRALGAGELLGRTRQTFCAAPALILSCSLLDVAIGEALTWLLLNEESLDWVVELRNAAVCIAAMGGTHALLGGIIALVVTDLYTGRRTKFSAAAREIAARGASIFLTGAYATVLAMIGFALLVAPGVLATMRWIYVVPVMAVERRYGRPGLRRSSELSRARSAIAFMLLLASLATWSTAFIGLSGASWATWSARLVVSAAASALLSTLIIVAYLDARTRSEALGAGTLADQRAG